MAQLFPDLSTGSSHALCVQNGHPALPSCSGSAGACLEEEQCFRVVLPDVCLYSYVSLSWIFCLCVTQSYYENVVGSTLSRKWEEKKMGLVFMCRTHFFLMI